MKKVIVISGGTDGLGLELARSLSPDHAVIILSRNEEKLKSVSEELGCDAIPTDVCDYSKIVDSVNTVLEKYGRIDCLINNAGIWVEGELESNNPNHIKNVIEVNTLGTIYLSKAVIPIMKKQKSGRIINVISQAGLYAKSERSVYTASKWATTGFTKSLQLEVAKDGISVTGFYPGLLHTKLFEKAGIDKDLSNALELKEAVRALEFLVYTGDDVTIPELGIKDIQN